jgi:adenine-specific DNA-methyltransferase
MSRALRVRLSADMAVPTASAPREALRVNGQFWTPSWVAEAMAAYALGGGARTLFDPGVGAGALLRAGRKIAGPSLILRGREIDPDALHAAADSGLTAADMSAIELRDFALEPPTTPEPAIIANPPYVRHHRLTPAAKSILHAFARDLVGRPIDGRAGLHVFFLLRCLELLAPNGRLAFIVSADICEGVFASTLWNWISRHFCIDAVVNFAPAASPFPKLDTNAILLLIRRAPPRPHLPWATVNLNGGSALTEWIQHDCPVHAHAAASAPPALSVIERTTAEATTTGLSRPPSTYSHGIGPVLGDYARVMRGIATGENDFFFMTAAQAAERGIPTRYLAKAVGRMRDVQTEPYTLADWATLESASRPSRLLALGDDPIEAFPPALQAYLRHGVATGVSTSTLIATRRPWYRMERREPPAFFFAYLGRREVRFIRNHAGVVPLTCLLCVYPHDTSPAALARLWRVLSDPRTVANLSLVGKSYGDGAIKVEPKALQSLPLPPALIAEAGLRPPALIAQPELVLV